MIIVLIGAPGSGKGTQAKMLADKLGAVHLSIGDILRQEIKQESDIGKLILKNIDEGKLVSDKLINEILDRNIDRYDGQFHYILDGYPRNIAQASHLNNLHKDILVIYLESTLDVVVKRISGRSSCNNCGEIYNEYFKRPKIEGQCNICGSKAFTKRNDDKEEIIMKRIEEFETQTLPVIEFLKGNNVVIRINADDTTDNVAKQIINAIKDNEKK